MDETLRIASAHEAMVELLRSIPTSILIRIASSGSAQYEPELHRIRERTPKIEISGLVKSARRYEPDLVYTVLAVGKRVSRKVGPRRSGCCGPRCSTSSR